MRTAISAATACASSPCRRTTRTASPRISTTRSTGASSACGRSRRSPNPLRNPSSGEAGRLLFADRREAGLSLASLLTSERDPLILGIARGGVVVAKSVAVALDADLDVVVIRKVGHPRQPELALGAVSASGESVVAPYAAEYFHGPMAPLFEEQARRARDLESRVRGDALPVPIEGRDVVIVDDGIATSATMEC